MGAWGVKSTIALALSILASVAASAQAQMPLSDTPEAFSQVLRAWTSKYSLGKAVVVVRHNGHIVHRGAVGGADPDAGYLLASLSKAITGACIAILIRDGKLSFETPLSIALAKFFKAHGRPADPRAQRITVAQLLTHRAGLAGNPDKDDGVTGRYLTSYLLTHSAGDNPAPALLAGALSRRLVHDPGAQFDYSNTGYLALGTIVEEVTGKPYESFCSDAVLKPVGVAARLDPTWRVLWSFGGWRLTPADYLAFYDQFDPARNVFGATAKTWMLSPAGRTTSADGQVWYGFGTYLRRIETGFNIWHTGSWRLANIQTFAVRRADGTEYFVWANHAPTITGMRGELDREMLRAYRAVKKWE